MNLNFPYNELEFPLYFAGYADFLHVNFYFNKFL